MSGPYTEAHLNYRFKKTNNMSLFLTELRRRKKGFVGITFREKENIQLHMTGLSFTPTLCSSV
jgi:hypothetical protein